MIKYILQLPDSTRITSGAGKSNSIEHVTLTETVNSDTELTLGSVCCTALEVSIITIDAQLIIEAGMEVTLYQLDDETDKETKVGVFLVEKPTKTSANRYKVTGYDRVSRLDKDVSAWLQSLTGWPYSIEELAQIVCNECGVALREETLPNGDFSVPRCPTTAAVTGRQIMQWIAEIAARFVTADADGVLRFGWYTDPDISIGPSGDNYFFSGSLSYEGYTVEPIDAVKVRLADSEDGLLWPENNAGNPYVVQGNKILSLALSEHVFPTLQNMLTTLRGISYTPCKVTVPISTGIKAGHIITIVDRNGTSFSTLVMNAVRTGQQIVIESTGSANRNSSENANTTTDADLREYAESVVNDQTPESLFNKLTNGGEMQGIYQKDGKIFLNLEYVGAGFISADVIKAGHIRSTDFQVTEYEMLYPSTTLFPGEDIYPSNGEEITQGFEIDFKSGVIRGVFWSEALETIERRLGEIESRLSALENA